MWSVYCLTFRGGKKTYVGATTNITRRLRQHNGELAGGAKYTTAQGNEWKLLFLVNGFPGRVEALQFEYALKMTTLRHRGTNNLEQRRIDALHILMQKDRVSKNAGLLQDLPLTIEYV